MKKWIRPFIYITFIIYSFIILDIVLLSRIHMFHIDLWIDMWTDRRLQYGINLVPFKTIFGYIKSIFKGNIVTIAARNLLGNLLMFLPLGIYLPIMREKCRTLKPTFLIALAVLIGIEIVQFLTLLGSLDIDDLILNLCGVLLGFGLWKSLKIIKYFNL